MLFDERVVEKAVEVMKKLGLKRFKFMTKEGEIEIELPFHESLTTVHALHTPIPSSPVFHHDEKQKVEERYITSPLVGTFYRRASPKALEYVTVGSKVDENTIVCIVEAMKVMNEVKASKSGTIVEILLNDSDPVEYGTKLFRIE